MRRLGAKSITALVVPDRETAWQILALNTEKAHNLKDRSLEVVRIYRGLVTELVTLGVCYGRLPRFGGGAYHPILRRLEIFSNEPLRAALKNHEKHASMVLDLEEKVAAAVKKLKERGLVSPYLRSFVVARINPLRWIKGEPPHSKMYSKLSGNGRLSSTSRGSSPRISPRLRARQMKKPKKQVQDSFVAPTFNAPV